MEEQPIFDKTFPDKRKGFYLALVTLLISNVITVFLAFYYGFDLINILWIYWFQSLIIGLVNVIEILALKKFSTEGIKPSLPADKPSSKFQVAFIFTMTYGLFHLAYAIFLTVFFTIFIKGTGLNWNMIIIGSLAFFIHYIIQFFSFSIKNNSSNIPSLAKLVIRPFYRIIPMHLTIIVAVWIFLIGSSSAGNSISIIILLIFTTIKTLVDIIIQFLAFKKQ
jgi:hypothetical protein